jgi:hypothetical protein
MFETLETIAGRDGRFDVVGVTPIQDNITHRVEGALISTPASRTCLMCGQELTFRPLRVEGYFDRDESLWVTATWDAAHGCGQWPPIASVGVPLDACDDPDRIRAALDRLVDERDALAIADADDADDEVTV